MIGLGCLLLPTLAVSAANARQRTPVLAPECNISFACDAPVASGASRKVKAVQTETEVMEKPKRVRRASREALAYAPADESGMPAASVTRAPATGSRGVSVSGIVPALAAKVAQIQSSCPGAQVISGVRHTRIRGTSRMSLHASGEAVDMRGNPSCVYAQLRDWPGGYSTDYGRVQHVHISLSSSGREMGLRFAHGGGGKSHRHRRYARR
jgi:hypothetical protein